MEHKLEEFAARQLLQSKNDHWRDDDEREVTEAEFMAVLALQSISVSSDGEIEFWFNDGGLFYGHMIVVIGNLQDGPTEANFHG